MKTGKLFVFEGIDGSGKSSLSGAFAQALEIQGVNVFKYSFPGRSPKSLGSLVYQIHHRPRKRGVERITPAALQTLHIAAHLDAIESQLVPRLKDGIHVILDRFWWSTWAYGLASAVPGKVLAPLIKAEREMWSSWKPKCVFYVERNSLRTRQQIDSESALAESYAALIRREKRHYPVHIIKNVGTLDQSLALILKHI